jgi:hypothetical protein
VQLIFKCSLVSFDGRCSVVEKMDSGGLHNSSLFSSTHIGANRGERAHTHAKKKRAPKPISDDGVEALLLFISATLPRAVKSDEIIFQRERDDEMRVCLQPNVNARTGCLALVILSTAWV